MKKRLIAIISSLLVLTASLAACSGSNNESAGSADSTQAATQSAASPTAAVNNNASGETKAVSDSSDDADLTYTGGYEGGAIDTAELFSSRDLKQEADLSGAKELNLSDGSDTTITEEGVYLISGSATNVSIIVDAADDAKVQLVLNNVSITNDSKPAIYVKSADKVFVTTAADSTNTLTVSGTFTSDGDTNTDAVIFSKDDLVFNGKGTLNISSTDNGISGKDDIKITGCTISVTSASDAIEANDSIVMADGSVTVNSGKDGLHAENDEDDTVGYIYIGGGVINATTSSDGIQATTILQIDGGNITVNGSEGLEATYVQINGGTVSVTASDDGINASSKSSAYSPTAEFNGGEITVDMGQGDTDAIDVNGNLYINGGTININAQSPFDYDGQCAYNGGTIYVNGQLTTEITNQMMGGPGGMGGRGDMGNPGGMAPGGF